MRTLLLAAILIAGCANRAPSSPPVLEAKKQTATEIAADARYRSEIHADLAANYYSRRQYDIALDELKIAATSDPKYVQTYNLFGLTYMELGEDRLAEENFAKALRMAQSNPDINNNYGWYLCNRKREKDSIAYFLTAAKDPLYQQPHKPLNNAGICSRRIGENADAEEYFRRALRIAPDDPNIHLQLADLNYSRNNLAQAKLHLTRVMEVPNPTAEILWLAVRMDRKLGDRNGEASNALKLRQRYPESKEAKLLKSGKYE
jgi:type IV pilus assembly protein PilF